MKKLVHFQGSDSSISSAWELFYPFSLHCHSLYIAQLTITYLFTFTFMLLPREPTNQGKMLSYVQEFHVYPLVEYTSVYNNYLFTCLSPPLEYKLLRAGLSHSSSYFQKLAPCMTSSMYKIMLNNLLILFVTLHILKPKLKGDTLKKNK